MLSNGVNKPAAAALVFAALAAAKTDLSGCTSSATVRYGGASMVWYVPDTGELCDFLDCGGGRAPPKTTVPGCAAYEGTATYEPSYLPGWGPDGKSSTSASASASHHGGITAVATATVTTDGVVETATVTAAVSGLSGYVESLTPSATGSSSSSSDDEDGSDDSDDKTTVVTGTKTATAGDSSTITTGPSTMTASASSAASSAAASSTSSIVQGAGAATGVSLRGLAGAVLGAAAAVLAI